MNQWPRPSIPPGECRDADAPDIGSPRGCKPGLSLRGLSIPGAMSRSGRVCSLFLASFLVATFSAHAQDRAGPDMDGPLPTAPGFSRESLEDMLDEARALVGTQRYPEAITAMKLYLEKASDDDQARLELARVYSWSKRYAESLALYDLILSTVPDDTELQLERAKVLLWANQYPAAAQSLAALRDRLNPPIDPGLPALGEDVEVSPALASSGPDALLERVDRALADAYAWSGQLDKAIPLYERLWYLHSDDRTLGLAYARALSQRRLYPQAIGIYDVLLSQGLQDPPFLLERGQVLLWGERYKEGLKALLDLRASLKKPALANGQASQIPPEFPHELDRAIAAGYAWAKDFPRAAQEYGTLVAEDPRNPTLRLELARVLRELNFLDGSIAQYDQYLQLKPDDLTIHIERARALLWAERYPEAIQSLTVLREDLLDTSRYGSLPDAERHKYQDEVDRLLTRCYVWSGKSTNALPTLQSLSARNPKDPQLALELAQTLAQAGQLEEARATYARYRALGGDSAIAHVKEGQTYQWEGDTLRANRSYTQALTANPSSAEAQQALAALAPWIRPPLGATLRIKGDSLGFSHWSLQGTGEYPYQLAWLGADLELDVMGEKGQRFVRLTPLVRGRYRHNKALSAKGELGLQTTFTGISPVGLRLAAEGRFTPEPTTQIDLRLGTSDATDLLFTADAVAQRFRQSELTSTLAMTLPNQWQVWGQLRAVGLKAPQEACGGTPDDCGNALVVVQGAMDWQENLTRPWKSVLRFGGTLSILHYDHPDPDNTYWSPALYASSGLRLSASAALPRSVSAEARLKVGLAFASDVGTFFPEVAGDLSLGQPLSDRISWQFEAGYGRTVREIQGDTGATDASPSYWSGRLLFGGRYLF